MDPEQFYQAYQLCKEIEQNDLQVWTQHKPLDKWLEEKRKHGEYLMNELRATLHPDCGENIERND